MTDTMPTGSAAANIPVPGGCEEAVYGVTPYQPCNKRAEVILGFEGNPGRWRYCGECAAKRTGAINFGLYEGDDFVEPAVIVKEGEAVQVSNQGGWGTQTVVEATAGIPETPEALKRRLVDEVQTWRDDKEALTAAKEKEAESRFTLTQTCFPNPVKGTQRYALDGGYNIKLVAGWNFKLGDKDLVQDGLKVPIYDQVVALEKNINALGPEGQLLVDRLIKWSPELVPGEYEKLARDDASEVEVQAKALIDEILTVTPASPQLTFEEPKQPK